MGEGDGEGSRGRIDEFKEYHTENTVHFQLTGLADQIRAMEKEGLEKVLKLRSSLSVSNFVLFDSDGKIKKYTNEKEVLIEFAELRLNYYQKRKDFHVGR